MAMFKFGKKIGPFDISGGLSRGDFQGSAYHKTDKDPRFKQSVNTDNTIGRFRAAMASSEGYARPNRFAIRIFPPSDLKQLIETKNSTTMREGETFDDNLRGVSNHGFMARNIQNLNQTIGRQVNIHCETVNMPGRDLQQQEVQYGTDVKRQMVQSHTYEGNTSATFYADKYLRERQFMEFWQNIAVDPVTHTAGYYDDYVGKMHIYQLCADSEKDRDMPTYAIEALDVYPATIGQIEYGYGKANEVARVTVEFAYKSWRNMGLETTTGLDYGHAMQTTANIKARDRGLFGRLPPSLQRAGKDIFQQGRTVLNPIGRIFKGKVFPPFT